MSLPGRNRQVVLKSRPLGIPQAEHFELATAPVPELGKGEFLVRNVGRRGGCDRRKCRDGGGSGVA